MRELVAAEDIECDWRERDAYTYTVDPDRVDQIAKEQEASAEAGLPATLVHEAPAPFEIAAAVRVTDQAEFHPRLYTLALARLAEAAGAAVHEGTRVLNVDAGTPCVIHTDQGELRADRVVIATHYPILDRGLFFSRLEVKRSYAIGVRIQGEAPTGMLYGIDSPTRSLRSHPLQGRELVIVGGEGHLTGDDPDTRRRFTALAQSAREWFDVEAIEYRWSAQDPESIDELPYAGSLVPGKDRILVTTGYRKWGFTNATAAAEVLHAQLGGHTSRFAEAYSTTRADVVRGAPKLMHVGARYAWRFARDRFGSPGPSSPEELARGEATVTGPPTSRVASFRDDDGVLHQVSAVCTHLACEVRWNSAERSWDCPCHASRFDPDGNVIEGPATSPLEAR
jgi:glycine/D-amino acid oxidase-like deaminating enzyme/nitrite reductase/ring-hydroxylating ferredoxin subunit